VKIESSGYADMSAIAASMRNNLRIGGEPTVGPSGATAPSDGGSFASVLEKTALAASDLSREGREKADAVAAGRLDDLHGTMITMKEADISMKLVGSVRDKLLDAFHELWRINV